MTPPSSVVRDVVAAATRAPSSHNTQPWRFRVRGSTVELHADRSRGLAVNDPDGRELVISCGAALLTLRVAAAHRGLAADVVLLPDPDDADLLARVGLNDEAEPDTALADLHGGILLRRTYRGAFDEQPVRAELLDRMTAAVALEGAVLHPIGAPGREEVARLVADGDLVQFADRSWRRELASWLRSPSSGDGLPVPPLALPATRLVVSALDLGRRTGAKDAGLVRAAPALALLSTRADEPSDWLRAGQALQRALLLAACEDVAAGYLNQPCQVGGRLRSALARQVPEPVVPQVLLRLGHPARETRPASRRPVRDALDDGQPHDAR